MNSIFGSFFGTPSKMVYHENGHYVRKTHRPYGYHKGSRSKTHKGRKDFTTKKGSKVFHRKGHYVRKSRRPYK